MLRQGDLISPSIPPRPRIFAGRSTITVLLAAALAFLALSCDDEKDPVTATPPVFSVTPVDIAFNPADSSFGDIVFQAPVLIPFGAPLLPDFNRFSPSFEYFTVMNAPIRAVAGGVVSSITENPIEEGGYEIRITCLPGSDYTVIYDHIIDVAVLEVSLVAPGDTLGFAGNWNDFMGHVELQVNTGDPGQERALCPLNFGDSAFKAQHGLLLDEYNRRDFSPKYVTLCMRPFVQE